MRRSLGYYAEATSPSPNAAHLFSEWGVVYAIMRDYPAAIERHEHSLAIDDQYDKTYLLLGSVYMEMNELEKAKETYLALAEIAPNSGDAHSRLAYLYGKEGDIEAAIAETLQVLELTTNNNMLYTSYKNLALSYQQSGDLEEALTAVQEALVRAPEGERQAVQELIAELTADGAASERDVMVQQFLSEGEAAIGSEHWARAEEAYQNALALDPTLVVAHSALAYVYTQQGRLEEAEQANQFVLTAKPGDFAALKNLAIIYRQLKWHSESIEYARQALASPEATEQEKSQLHAFIEDVESLRSEA